MSAADALDASDFEISHDARRRVGAEGSLNLHDATEKLERELIERALERAYGNRAEAVRLLGIARPQLYAKVKDLAMVVADRPKKQALKHVPQHR